MGKTAFCFIFLQDCTDLSYLVVMNRAIVEFGNLSCHHAMIKCLLETFVRLFSVKNWVSVIYFSTHFLNIQIYPSLLS